MSTILKEGMGEYLPLSGGSQLLFLGDSPHLRNGETDEKHLIWIWWGVSSEVPPQKCTVREGVISTDTQLWMLPIPNIQSKKKADCRAVFGRGVDCSCPFLSICCNSEVINNEKNIGLEKPEIWLLTAKGFKVIKNKPHSKINIQKRWGTYFIHLCQKMQPQRASSVTLI